MSNPPTPSPTPEEPIIERLTDEEVIRSALDRWERGSDNAYHHIRYGILRDGSVVHGQCNHNTGTAVQWDYNRKGRNA